MTTVIRVNPDFTLVAWTDDATHLTVVESDLMVTGYSWDAALAKLREHLSPPQLEAIWLWGSPLTVDGVVYHHYRLNQWSRLRPSLLHLKHNSSETLTQEMGRWTAVHEFARGEGASPSEALAHLRSAQISQIQLKLQGVDADIAYLTQHRNELSEMP